MGPVNMPIRSSAYALWTSPVLRAAGFAQDHSEVPCVLSVPGSSLSEAELMQ
jgi:hypothetical protein